MSTSDFVHLHLHTQYSLLDGACQLDRLIAKAKDLQMPALAMTDHGNLFGAVDFYTGAKKAGIKPILGCEVYMAPGSRLERSPQDGQYEGANHLTLLCKDAQGYKNLLKLVTAGYQEGFYYKPRIDHELFQQFGTGLIALSGCLNSELGHALLDQDEAKAAAIAKFYMDVVGPDAYYLEIQDHGITEQRTMARGILPLAKKLGVPVVATNDVHYLNAGDHKAHEILLCIQTGSSIKDDKRWRFPAPEFYLKSPEEMGRLFAEIPEVLTRTREIAERCNVDLTFGKIRLPKYAVPEGFTRDGYLKHLAEEGLRRRYGTPGPAVEARLAYELGVIEKMGFAGYFLVVWDFITYAKSRGIPVGPGRGSAAGSLVAYCLGITNIDPVRYDLLFERFLNPERISMPDMDIDFCDQRRDEVIEYVRKKYGAENVSQIITFGTLGAKAVIRDVARGMGMTYAEGDKIAKMVPNTLNISLEDAVKESSRLQEAMRAPEIAELISTAKVLEGLTRHASTHAAGVVISSEPLTEHVPLYKGAKGEITTQYAMGAIEKIGLLKMDFLGLRTLTVIMNTLTLIKVSQGTEVDLDHIPMDDAASFQLLTEARTSGVFQLESSGMRDLLRQMKPTCVEDIIALVAMYRPGPMEQIPKYIERKHGRSAVVYEHPKLEGILKETYGIMVYQEQVMRVASDLAGLTLGEADILRRAMGKKSPELMAEQRKKFVEGAVKQAIKEQLAGHIFDLMEKFAGYGFNKSHAAAYGLLAYQTAWLKATYPVEFMAALLSSEMSDTDKIVKYIEECRAMGIEVLPPDVNESGSEFSVTEGKIRFGLVALKNVGQGAIEAIVAARHKDGRFTDFFEFCDRVDLRAVNRRVIEALIRAGALDGFRARRSQMWAVIDRAMEAAAANQRDRAQGQGSLLDLLAGPAGPRQSPALPDFPEWERADMLRAEKETLGFYISGHPLAAYRAVLAKEANVTTETIGTVPDRSTVRLGAMVTAVKPLATKNGDRMAFLTLEDLHGTLEAVVFPEPYRAHGATLAVDAAVLVTGQVDIGEETTKLLVFQAAPLASFRPAGQSTASVAVITVQEPVCSVERLTRLERILQQHAGDTPVEICLHVPGTPPVTIQPREALKVTLTPEFTRTLEQEFGAGCVAQQERALP